ncbi:serine protease [Massilia sp. YMA4]|uniref:trypsin-like serine peptidase n=1 Tax=Massilia sp. YMA4 TaxID=1593482 RepID=UPI000DD16BB6|nr:serine protease [Massilia sp. YMA4]AXA89817.1 hypothetical protein DPH57_00675 [Massilia sp. YMA4]
MDENDTTQLLRAILTHLGQPGAAMAHGPGHGAEPAQAAAELKARLSPEQWTAAGRLLDGHALELDMPQRLLSAVRAVGRPAVLVRHGDFEVGPPWQHLMAQPLHDTLTEALLAVGLIEIPGDLNYPLVGTGLLVGELLVMTNRHVAELFAEALGTPAMRLRDGMAPVINFRREVSDPPGDPGAPFAVAAVHWVHPRWDLALLRLEEQPPVTPLRLARHQVAAGDEIVVLGYPGADNPGSPVEQELYQNIYDVKRLLPGQLHPTVQIAGLPGPVLRHDSSTLGGSSGSPLLEVETGLVVGLHYRGGDPFNYAIPTSALASDPLMAQFNEMFTG